MTMLKLMEFPRIGSRPWHLALLGWLLMGEVVVGLPQTTWAEGTADAPAALPRAYTTVGPLEVVLIAAPTGLYAFVDRQSDNTPATLNSLGVDSGKKHWTLEESGPGLYQVSGAVLGTGRVPLLLTVSGEGVSGTAETAIDMPVPATVKPLGRPRWQWWLIIAVAGLATAGGAWWLRGKLSRWFGFAG